MSNVKLDVRVYPLQESDGATLAFASVGIADLVAIKGIRVVENGEGGRFVSMPQSLDKKTGEYHDVAFPIDSDLGKELRKAVLREYKVAVAGQKQGMGERLQEGKDEAAKHNQEHAAAPRRAAKGAPGMGDD